ncbi:hypothetical protein SAMN02745164_00726 [Marinitoga hydrogenitolerans DSM 16785]|uniref:Outer membrane protein beta-barrel domain-containing protein n=1 Tax=Marinitoga hydrogenitolerans (strain DSM 16785 / JCM 12826 / AT1271) TaxID=1122195 RepID=A0A1M4UM05_MARH1|nr:hypothetical protein [Marinitoga hydrogenitolerans]SHE57687.1 hypothetical protein SAMN02745164_00726 [Marinitoga hydrogenitolerans DSM 16785]
MKKNIIIFILILSIFSFSNSFSYTIGIAVSGALFPYFGVCYNMDSIQIGGSLGFILEPDKKNPEQWNYLFSPALNVDYFITKNLSIGLNSRVLIVVPYQYEQLYLSGIGVKYGFPLNNNKINLSLSGNFVLPISAGERTWEKDREPYIPIPFLQGEYEF